MIAITGAGGGIGKYLFHSYSEKGENVYGTCHSAESSDIRITKVDVSRPAEVNAWVGAITKPNSEPITLINCAAINYSAFAHKSDPVIWHQVIEVNLAGTYNVIRAFLPIMRSCSFGRIINFSSVVAEIGVVGTSAYAASKAGLWGLSRALCVENASKNITINNINLGYSDIGMGIAEIGDQQKKELLGKIPAGRFCTADEIIQTVEYLRHVEYANGISISLNGGLA